MIVKIIAIVLLVDSLLALLLALFGKKWYLKHFQIMSRMVPLALPWVMLYVVLVGWIMFLTFGVIN